jgi:ubiquinone/menaquinone biosynthesis C-methylase UbiE
MSITRIREIYDREAESYDRSLGWTESLLLGAMRQQFGELLHGRTLEVAIGTGLNLPYYSSKVTEAIGIDLSSEMLQRAQAKSEELGRPIELVQMDAQHLAFESDTFDTVATSLSLCTVPDPRAALREFARVCRPEGSIVLLEHVRSPILPVAWMQRAWSPIQERALGCHLARRTIDLAVAEGFSVTTERQKLLGIFRLVRAHPPSMEEVRLVE